jgi:hypothetical protein
LWGECHRGLESLFNPASTGNVEIEVAPLVYNRAKPGVRKNAAHTLFSGKARRGPGIFGAWPRQRWNVFKRGAQGQGFSSNLRQQAKARRPLGLSAVRSRDFNLLS